ncbi:Cellulase (glycosyl hydrolase family 5) (plasmid) [Mycobacterium sp. JS623]|uniref:cellulase family glycosylhydrolase n=1 Tax=Mycobacterium sp. JS623 TaxID=212767 RepID=UPI0002A56DE5|nr:cellulase family glycosylhydrolase [Mycobacterium sp. JS623]AGB26661.1 Cellulase (glycosyl hydrolase family 5) [Mycobacterium sp. JS623]
MVVSVVAQRWHRADEEGFRVVDGRLMQADGTPFVMRGTNHMYTWNRQRTDVFAAVKALGANTLRVVLSGGRWEVDGTAEVASVVALCKQNKLVCVLEDHDTTEYPTAQTEWTLDRAADYWISLKGALIGQEDYVLINLGNEPYTDEGGDKWVADTESAIQKVRGAGLRHTLVIDPPNYGQDTQFIMRDNASQVLASDPEHNVVFSVHMYGAFVSPDKVISYMDSFQTRRLPLVVGEFGYSADDVNLAVRSDADTIMAESVRRGIGYLGWCWSGNPITSLAPHLDQVVDFDPNRLTYWGQRLFNGRDGIKQTSAPATVYGR